MDITINSLKLLSEHLGFSLQVENTPLSKSSNSIDETIVIFNEGREIYGTFNYYAIDSATYYKFVFGSLLMPEVDFGVNTVETFLQEFRSILSSLFVLINKKNQKKIIENDLKIDEYYLNNDFSYNIIDDMDEFYRLELLLFSHIKDRNKLAAIKTLELFIKHYYQELTSTQLKCFYISLITLLTRVEIEKGNPVNEVFEKQLQYYNYMNEIKNLATFETILKQAIHDYFHNYTAIPKKTYSPVIVCVLNMIENSLYKNITLAAICSDISKEPKYVGRLFFQEVGIRFKDYYLLKKIERSKYLLLFSAKTINEVSEDLAFCSQSHFTTSFKKIVGITPKDYKKRHVYYSY